MRPRNLHDTKYNDSSRASVSRCTRSITPIIASFLRRRVQLLPAGLSQAKRAISTWREENPNAYTASLLAWTCLLLEFRQLLHGYSDQQPPCGPVFRLSAGQRLISRSARPRQVLRSFVQGLEIFLTSALHIASKRNASCRLTSLTENTELHEGKACHVMPRHGGTLDGCNVGVAVGSSNVRWKGNNNMRLVLAAMTFLVSAAPASS
jgi:hypothetical protein